ncbi:hypothetical protein [Streptomyces griseus]|uniref:PspA-associated protein PspAB n=1 Tax=Streptomyces griseus TaxID=1911 RepID=UPI0004CA51B1|nr:hypothetical protein [Streptomyces griseus]
MGLLDSLLGRARPVRPDLDRLFALPSAALTLRAATGFAPTGAGSVCFATVEGGTFARLKEEVRVLLDTGPPAGRTTGPGAPADAGPAAWARAGPDAGAAAGAGPDAAAEPDAGAGPEPSPVAYSSDPYGYTWLTVHRPAEDLISLVNDLHAVNTLLEEAGYGPNLLCSLTAFRAPPPDGTAGRPRDLALVYLYKRGTFYPFAPLPDRHETRDTTLEVRLRGLLADDLATEPDLERWFPLWNAPGLGPC